MNLKEHGVKPSNYQAASQEDRCQRLPGVVRNLESEETKIVNKAERVKQQPPTNSKSDRVAKRAAKSGIEKRRNNHRLELLLRT